MKKRYNYFTTETGANVKLSTTAPPMLKQLLESAFGELHESDDPEIAEILDHATDERKRKA